MPIANLSHYCLRDWEKTVGKRMHPFRSTCIDRTGLKRSKRSPNTHAKPCLSCNLWQIVEATGNKWRRYERNKKLLVTSIAPVYHLPDLVGRAPPSDQRSHLVCDPPAAWHGRLMAPMWYTGSYSMLYKKGTQEVGECRRRGQNSKLSVCVVTHWEELLWKNVWEDAAEVV